jgi:hypothetical protein
VSNLVSLASYYFAAADPAPATSIDLNALVGGGAGASLIGIIFYVGKLILDRTIPSRSDSRANISVLLDGLQSMVKVLQDEKAGDAKRLADRQARIDTLEEESDVNYVRRAEMQADIIELKARVAQKDRHIRELTHMLTQLGATVVGEDTEHLDITLPASEVAQIRKDAQTNSSAVS